MLLKIDSRFPTRAVWHRRLLPMAREASCSRPSRYISAFGSSASRSGSDSVSRSLRSGTCTLPLMPNRSFSSFALMLLSRVARVICKPLRRMHRRAYSTVSLGSYFIMKTAVSCPSTARHTQVFAGIAPGSRTALCRRKTGVPSRTVSPRMIPLSPPSSWIWKCSIP